MGTKNKLASLAFLQRKPYINARVPRVHNKMLYYSLVGERLKERERERERERVIKFSRPPNIKATIFVSLTLFIYPFIMSIF